MRIGFLGDIHGNLYALEACLRHLDQLKVDQVYCLGDLVGWLPFGDKTLERMRRLGFPTVVGNHDLLVTGMITDAPDQIDRMQASAYNAGRLSMIPGALDYLTGLPLRIDAEDFTVVHHSPFHLPKAGYSLTIEAFGYLDDPALGACLIDWAHHPKPLLFTGHDHIPAVYELPDSPDAPRLEQVIRHRPAPRESLTMALKHGSRYWIKAGSVGGPYRDGILIANAVLYDDSRETLTLVRLPYPTAELYREIASNRFCRQIPTLQRYLALLT